MDKAKVFIYQKPFEGNVGESNFKLVEENLPDVKDGEFLAEALYLSVDPYMRGGRNVVVGGPFTLGTQVAKVIQSKHPKFPTGSHIIGYFGWRTHTISNAQVKDSFVIRNPYLLPDFQGLPLSLALGTIGMPGCTAYFGVEEVLKPKPGETMVVSSAAGAVGNVAGQIGKIHGCKVIGIAGSDEKGEWLVKELGYDHFINYKTSDVDKELKKIAPEGIHCYFDNTGGDITKAVVNNMNNGGRIAFAGAISTRGPPREAQVSEEVVATKNLTTRRYNVHEFVDKFPLCIKQHLQWVKEGKMKYHEAITEGFENMPKAFIDLFRGVHYGKIIIKV